MDLYSSSTSTSFATPISQNELNNNSNSDVLGKSQKRKRLTKACDACHKSKRRCDGTAPCSNCYYAAKPCSYTDASGRPVAPPRPARQDRPEDPRAIQPASRRESDQSDDTNDPKTYYQNQSRKRFRNEQGNAVAAETISTSTTLPMMDGPLPAPIERPPPMELDHPLTRELTNLFFTHCHPAKAVIHKPTFSASLAHNRVPNYLLHAVCALAAPLSKQPKLRTNPSRYAGRPFAQEALSIMFDGAGRLVCERNLATAQALCLLQVHDIATKDQNVAWDARYHDLALQIVETLQVYQPDYPTLTPIPSPEFIQKSIEREAMRRVFWLIQLMDNMAHIFFKKPMLSLKGEGLHLRLPADETSFELGVHSTLPEYLDLPPIRTQYSSEFGHLIRVVTIYDKIEDGLVALDSDSQQEAAHALQEAEQNLDSWAQNLADHLRFSESNLLVQQSMFETSSNTGAWCWCLMHTFHASAILALNSARQRLQRGPKSELQWAANVLNSIMTMLGDRAKNSPLMGSILFAFVKYLRRDDSQMRAWLAEYEDSWGARMKDVALERHTHSPPRISYRQPQYQTSQSSRPAQHDSPYDSHSVSTRSPSQEYHRPENSTSNNRNVPPNIQALSLEREANGRGPPPGPYPFDGTTKPEDVHGANLRSGDGHRHVSNSSVDSHSLPSLKSSGLLESWAQSQANNANTVRRQSPPRRSPTIPHSQDYDGRPAGLVTTGMPVGLRWLADESR